MAEECEIVETVTVRFDLGETMKKKVQGRVLAEGEVTGHYHALDHSDVFDTGSTRVFDVEESDTLTHQEHGPIEIPAGEYESGIVLEYDHFAEESREVVD